MSILNQKLRLPLVDARATSDRVSGILNKIESGTLLPRPEFQRRLIWTQVDKNEFLRTVLLGYPFPEIYVARGQVDESTAGSVDALVDGQQRVTTLHQYFKGSGALTLDPDIPSFQSLGPDEKKSFLNSTVAVRDLGLVEDSTIRDIFQRINRTPYSLNRMEQRNAAYQGKFKKLGVLIGQSNLFKRYRVFSNADVRRMVDVTFGITLAISMLGNYFNRESEIENYLETYNESFPEEAQLRKRLAIVFRFVLSLKLDPQSRAWKRADLLVLLCELDRILNIESKVLDTAASRYCLNKFYAQVNAEMASPSGSAGLQRYFKSTVQATNDRSSRIARAEAIYNELIQAVMP